jgi:pimeloyl-ACP methyl ester carboxylesterase
MHPVRPWARRAVPVLLTAAALLGGCAGLIRERMYQPDPLAAAGPAWPGRAPQPVRVATADGLALEGWYWPPAAPGRDLIVFFHGNAGNRDTAARMAEPLSRDGRGLLVASYRGYGANPGRPTREGLIRDADAFVAEARRLAPDSPLVLFGYSLGGAVALEQATRQRPRMVITLGAFARIADLAPWAVRGIMPDRWDNLEAIRRVEAPVLIVHGTADETVPYAHAGRLHAAAPRTSRVLTLEGANHHPDLARLAADIWREIDQAPR